MASERWEQLEDLFAQAVALTGAGRDAFLARACDGAPELRRELEALLRHADDDRDEGAAGRVVAAAIFAPLPRRRRSLGSTNWDA